MIDNKSPESLFVAQLGRVTVRGLTVQEAAGLYVIARKKSLGNQSAMKWLLLIGSLCLGVVSPKLTRDTAERYVKNNAKEAALMVTRIVELTHD